MIEPSILQRPLALLLPIALAMAPAATAQPDPAAGATARLVKAESDVRAVDRSLDRRLDDEGRAGLRNAAAEARANATAATGDLGDQLSLIDARIAELGPASAGEADDLRTRRAALTKQRATIDSTIKRGRLIGIEAQQLVDEIARSRAEQFGQTISAHVPSPLAPAFWSAVLRSLPRDMRRIADFADRGAQEMAAGWRTGSPWPALLGLLCALVLLIPGRTAAHRIARRMLVDDAPGHRVRRSANAMWRVTVGTFAPLIAMTLLAHGLRWSRLQPPTWDGLLDALVTAATFTGFSVSVTGALLMRSQPSWRVAPIADDVARELRPFTWLLGALAFVSIMINSFNQTIGASSAALSATQAVEIMLHLILLIGALVGLGRLRAAREDEEAAAPARAGLGAAALVAWIVVTAALIALLIGYLGFALFLVQLTAWGVVLGSASYLLMAVVDDLATTLFTRDSSLGHMLSRALGIRGAMIDQFGVLLSGALRVVLALAAFGLLFSPFGGGGGVGALFGQLGTLAHGVKVGGIQVSPGTLLRGAAVLFIGLTLVRAFMRWLEVKYLPATDLDGSGRNSVSLVARYVGIALAVIWSLASLGIGVERIALLLSALSVGIGFGLQAITQNFVSGLILLAERPIKIGDWIRVGADEGDVKRISVRSTEIGLPDHSTLIVPNSELITKSVLNKTLSSAMGRMQIQFSVPLESDADRVREIVAHAFATEDAVLDDPAPAVFIDSIVDGRIFFNCFAHVASPRSVYSARSAILTVLLRRFREEEIELGSVPQRMELLRAPTAHAPPTHEPPARGRAAAADGGAPDRGH